MKKFWLSLLIATTLLNCRRSGDGDTKLQQYYVQGEKLYKQHCSNCHQSDGSGLGRVFPPLNKSDYMDSNYESVVCLIKNGKKGQIVVNGIQYNKEMPAMPSLTDLEIAEIVTFIYNNWERKKGLVSVQEISPILMRCDSVDN